MALIEKTGRFECHLTIEEVKASAPELLMAESGFSKQKIKTIMQKGAVWLSRGQSTQRLRRVKKALQKGDQLHLYYDGRVLSQPTLSAKLLFDCTAYSIWLKPSGMLSQGSKWGDHTTIVRWAESELNRVTYQLHRLDRATSGLIMVAHSKKMAKVLTGMFERRAIKKSYQALVVGQFPEDVVTLDGEVEGRSAISHAERLGYDCVRNASWVGVEIETGRKHQIRRHLSERGFPIVGDRLYGEANEKVLPDLQLMAVKLLFDCPVEGVVREVEVPESLGQRALTNGYNWR